MESSRHLSGSYQVSITDQSLALNKFSNRGLKYLIWPYDLFPGLWENISPASQRHCAAVSLGITLPTEGPGSCSGLPRPRVDRWGPLASQPCGPSGRAGGCLDLRHRVDRGRVTEEVRASQSAQTFPAGPSCRPHARGGHHPPAFHLQPPRGASCCLFVLSFQRGRSQTFLPSRVTRGVCRPLTAACETRLSGGPRG